MSMSIMRVIAPMAWFVCKVARWPVSATLNCISAVSLSRISPTMTMPGLAEGYVAGCSRMTSRSCREPRQVDDINLVFYRIFDGNDVFLDAVFR